VGKAGGRKKKEKTTERERSAPSTGRLSGALTSAPEEEGGPNLTGLRLTSSARCKQGSITIKSGTASQG